MGDTGCKEEIGDMKEKGNDAMRGERRIREIKARAIAAGITVAFMLAVGTVVVPVLVAHPAAAVVRIFVTLVTMSQAVQNSHGIAS